MNTKTNEGSITFKVHDVARETEPFRLGKTRDSISQLLAGDFGQDLRPVLSCSGYNSDCVENITAHALISAVHMAFSQHRPLVLSPDMIWITIVQGLAQHIRNNAEMLRDKIVRHSGKMVVNSVQEDIFLASPETAWDAVIHDLSRQVGDQVSDYQVLLSDFSTTGDIERTVCEIALLDAFQPFFEYAVYCMCGIPEITLEGQPADWNRLLNKIDALEPYELDWWLPHLRVIAKHFERASRGDIDTEHWQNIYKLKKAYGWDRLNGWILKLFPYVKNFASGNFTNINPLFYPDHDALWDEPSPGSFAVKGGITSRQLPSGLAQVPFTLHNVDGSYALEFLGGFVGVEQDEQTLALRPKLGWAVRYASEMDQCFANLPTGLVAAPPVEPALYDECMEKLIAAANVTFSVHIPQSFFNFYKRCDGVLQLSNSNHPRQFNIRRLQDVEYDQSKSAITFADFADGTCAALSVVSQVVLVGEHLAAASFDQFFMDLLFPAS